MQTKEGYFQGSKEYKLFYKSMLPDKPKAIVQILHGFCEYTRRYTRLIERLTKEGFAVFIHDHKGHGKSDGKRNHIMSLDTFAEDAYLLTKQIKDIYPDTPFFLIAHSMGSLVAQRYTIAHQDEITGLILSGSGTGTPPFPKLLEVFARIMVKIIPTLTGDAGIDPINISSDPESVKDYSNDPLINYKKGTIGMGIAMMDHYKEIKHKIGQIHIPVLLQRGKEDVMMIGESELFEDLTTKDKQLIYYDKAKHEVYQEIEEIREKVFSDLVNWINKHL